MSTKKQVVVEILRQAREAFIVLGQNGLFYAREAYVRLSQVVSKEGFGGGGGAGADPGPAIVLMIGGLVTLATILALAMARRSLGSTPEAVNTRQSKQKAREAVDIYVDGSPDEDRPTRTSEAGSVGTASAGNPSGGTDAGAGKAAGDGPLAPEWVSTTSLSSSADGGDRDPSPAGGDPDPPDSQDGSEPSTSGGGAQVGAAAAAQAARPTGEGEGAVAAAGAEGSPNSFERGRAAGARVDADDSGEVLRCLVEARLGSPMIVRSTGNLSVIRLEECLGCSSDEPGDRESEAQPGCPFEAGFIEGAMSQVSQDGVVVRETACRRWGDEACEFEIWF